MSSSSWAVVILVPVSIFMFFLMGTRLWLDVTDRRPSDRLRRWAGIDGGDQRASSSGVIVDAFFVILPQLLAAIAVVDSASHGQAGVLPIVAGVVDMVFVAVWVVVLVRESGASTR